MEVRRGAYRVLVRKLSDRDHLEDPSIDRTIILNGFSRSGMGTWAELTCLRIGTGGGLL
jgi:hypothetical protein